MLIIGRNSLEHIRQTCLIIEFQVMLSDWTIFQQMVGIQGFFDQCNCSFADSCQLINPEW